MIAIQVVDYDTNRAKGITKKPDHVEDTLVARASKNPLPEGQFLKEYEVRCKQSDQTIEHFSMVQIELPRAEKQQKLFPSQKDFSETMWFLSVLRHADKYTKAMVEQLEAQQAVPDFIKRMLHRLTFDVWQPTLLREYKEGVDDRVAFATEYAVERKEGRLEVLENVFALVKSGKLDSQTVQENFSLNQDEMRLLEEQLAGVSLQGRPIATHKKLASNDTGHD
ncbi:MAG: hypothetical protein ACPG7U_05320 [Holosporaceae bacterium]